MNMTNATSETKANDVSGFVDRIVRPLTHLFNPLILKVAGGRWVPMFSLLHHRGRKSGRIYTTPVTGFPRGGSSGWAWRSESTQAGRETFSRPAAGTCAFAAPTTTWSERR